MFDTWDYVNPSPLMQALVIVVVTGNLEYIQCHLNSSDRKEAEKLRIRIWDKFHELLRDGEVHVEFSNASCIKTKVRRKTR